MIFPSALTNVEKAWFLQYICGDFCQVDGLRGFQLVQLSCGGLECLPLLQGDFPDVVALNDWAARLRRPALAPVGEA